VRRDHHVVEVGLGQHRGEEGVGVGDVAVAVADGIPARPRGTPSDTARRPLDKGRTLLLPLATARRRRRHTLAPCILAIEQAAAGDCHAVPGRDSSTNACMMYVSVCWCAHGSVGNAVVRTGSSERLEGPGVQAGGARAAHASVMKPSPQHTPPFGPSCPPPLSIRKSVVGLTCRAPARRRARTAACVFACVAPDYDDMKRTHDGAVHSVAMRCRCTSQHPKRPPLLPSAPHGTEGAAAPELRKAELGLHALCAHREFQDDVFLLDANRANARQRQPQLIL